MSVKNRWMLAAVTAALWGAWLWCASTHDDDATMHIVSEGLRSLFIVAAVALVLACLVTPMAALLQIGRQIGRAEHRRECGCHTDDSGAHRSVGQVLPFKPTCRN